MSSHGHVARVGVVLRARLTPAKQTVGRKRTTWARRVARNTYVSKDLEQEAISKLVYGVGVDTIDSIGSKKVSPN